MKKFNIKRWMENEKDELIVCGVIGVGLFGGVALQHIKRDVHNGIALTAMIKYIEEHPDHAISFTANGNVYSIMTENAWLNELPNIKVIR